MLLLIVLCMLDSPFREAMSVILQSYKLQR